MGSGAGALFGGKDRRAEIQGDCGPVGHSHVITVFLTPMKRQLDEITLPMEQGDVKRARVLQSLTPDQAQELAAIHAEADDMNRAQRDIIAMEETDDHNKDRLSVQTDLMKAMVTLRA